MIKSPTSDTRDTCVLFVQHGSFRETYMALSAGKPETYRDQKSSVDFVKSLSERARVVVLSLAGTPHALEALAPNLDCLGILRKNLSAARVAEVLREVRPTHIVLRTPLEPVLRQAGRQGIHVLPNYADIFDAKTWRARWRLRRLQQAHRVSGARVLSNHSLNASRSMISALGCAPEMVVPWDWTSIPVNDVPKTAVQDSAAPTVLLAGAVTENKGVGDLIAAVDLLRAEGMNARATIAGWGDVDQFTAQVRSLGLEDAVKLPGALPNAEIRSLMRSHDIVVVPSRHSYNEGLPNTIYEALASRTPLVMSDHPAFKGRLQADTQSIVFEAGNPASLAAALRRLAKTPALYATLSQNAAAAHDGLYVGMEWNALITAFLVDPLNETNWVQPNSLQALLAQ